MISRIHAKLAVFFISSFFIERLFSQKNYYGDNPVKWQNNLPVTIPEYAKNYSSSDLIVLSDNTEFYFYASNNEKIARHITFLINTQRGAEVLKKYKLPESLDQASDEYYYKQGRESKIKTPFIKEYDVKLLAARKFSDKKWHPMPFKENFEKVRWIRKWGDDAGEFIYDDLHVFNFDDLAAGDVVELYYESTFNSDYGDNIFYFTSRYPKLSCEYTFVYKVNQPFADYAFIKTFNIPDSLVKMERTNSAGNSIITERIKLDDVQAINYPANSCGSKKLPCVFADFRFYRTLNNSYPDGGGRVYDFGIFRPKHFEWVMFIDTSNYYTKVYDKQFASLRKFVAKLPPVIGPDSTSKTFFKALCDTFNSFRYITSNQLYYNESSLLNIYSADHVLKRRLVEHQQWKLYRDILNDSKVFYYVANIQDKRYGEHDMHYRACYSYERNLIAIPSKDSYIYFMPRYGGLKYHVNELPFYLEGALASLSPHNFQDDTKNKEEKFFKFIKTHKGTFNENTRTENVSVRISLDSLKADLTIKESLSGQFSTVLRHYYLNEYIDSTISPHYFKKCTDKPLASQAKIKLSSKMSDFPFRYNFACSEKINLPSNNYLNLKNWFSFPLSAVSVPEKPLHDYYFDFDFSDTYNFLLNFNVPVELKNTSSFARKINNDYFSLDTEIISNSESSYLLKVALVVKQTNIPENKMNLLMDLINELESLNKFTLELANK